MKVEEPNKGILRKRAVCEVAMTLRSCSFDFEANGSETSERELLYDCRGTE